MVVYTWTPVDEGTGFASREFGGILHREVRLKEDEAGRDIMQDKIKKLLSEFKSGLEIIYGPRLHGVYLYGSYARNEAEPESDVDILIVLDQVDAYGKEIEATSCLVASLSLKNQICISRIFVPQNKWFSKGSFFVQNASEDAVSL